MSDTPMELLPCPFCGVAPRLTKECRVICLNDSCSAKMLSMKLDAWNTRTPSLSPAETAKVREALEEYGKHHSDCALATTVPGQWHRPQDCTCGLNQALALLDKK